MEQSNNPAGRLLRLLREGKKANPDKRIREVWAELLDVPVDDLTLLLRRLGKVIELPAAVQDQVREHPDITPDVYLKWLPKIERALSVLNLAAQWKSVIAHVDEAAIFGLEICDDVLARYRPDTSVTQETLEAIHQDARGLFDKIVSSDLSASLRDFLLNHLKQIDRAIQEYKISGTEPILAAVESAFGTAILNQELAKAAYSTKEGKSVWKIVTRVAAIFSIATNAATLTEGVVGLFPDSLSSSEQTASPSRATLTKQATIESDSASSDA